MANAIGGILSFVKLKEYYEIYYATGETSRLHILNSHVFRFYMSPSATFKEYPDPINPKDTAKINVKKMSDYGIKTFESSKLQSDGTSYIVNTDKIALSFDILTGTMKITDKRNNKVVLSEFSSLTYIDFKSTQTLEQAEDEHFFGGGMQNGRFTHKGELINIANTNNWVDGGVTSPCPFYWSTYGYGVLRNTWQPGIYDFGQKTPGQVRTIHKGRDFDAFYFINSQPKDILNDYYELTGHPIFMPIFTFYEAHLNAFNRDYWVEVTSDTSRAVLFEDGKYYKSYKPNEIGDKKGILESLNGEKNNYQFSARAMIDRYKKYDMPLGWFVPNDGYGCGYGQTDTFEGDLLNLKEFADYSRASGVEVALWTESNLHPADPDHPKKGERDLGKEVGEAGVIALKCDVAWIGSGYSFGLTAVDDATEVFNSKTKGNKRPMIIMVDGWAGTQRYSGIWSGDQSGGLWEYIRFHIPTYIGAGLSGLPLIGSDMDGIYAGGTKEVNIRDYQWKTFTPLQLNMDGWGDKPKTPFSYDDEATNINRAYLKLKSMLMPYNYTLGHESIQGLPMIRAMFLEFPDEPLAYTKASQYQFMWGPNILVAPIYNEENVESSSLRNEIFLPGENDVWFDFFTGDKYKGGKILSRFMCPLWKIPVFIRNGAIIPMVNSNNNPTEIEKSNRIYALYPGNGNTTFEVYEDDGLTSDYQHGHFAKTQIDMISPKSTTYNNLYINIGYTRGSYNGLIKKRSTLLLIKSSFNPENVSVAVGKQAIQINKATTDKEFDKYENAYYYKKDYVLNPYLITQADESIYQSFILIKIKSVDVTANQIQMKIKNFNQTDKIHGKFTVNQSIDIPVGLKPLDDKITSTSVTFKWDKVDEANSYEIKRDGYIITNIVDNIFICGDLKYESKHSFQVRSVINDEVSNWSDIIEILTKEDPYKFTVKNVKVTCNIPCEPCHEIDKLTDGDFKGMWHTNWTQGQAKPQDDHFLTLLFDLGEPYDIHKIEYVPRDDGGNGTFLELQYRLSLDGAKWSEESYSIVFPQDESVKVIPLNKARFRYMEVKVIESVGGFGSGKQFLFYKEI